MCGLNENSPDLWAPVFEYLIPSWWNCLGRVRRRDFVCGWGPTLRLQKACAIPRVFSASPCVDPHVSSLLSLLTRLCSASMDSNEFP